MSTPRSNEREYIADIAIFSKPITSDPQQFVHYRLIELLRIAMFSIVVLIGFGSNSVFAQQSSAVQGKFLGSLGPLHVELHLDAAPDGTLSGTLDSPDQGAFGIPCADFHVDGKNFAFNVPMVSGSWKGSVESEGTTLVGTWTQGMSMPLTFTRDTFVAATKPSPVDGFWLGTLQTPTQSLKTQIVVKSDNTGGEFCTLDSFDAHALNVACANVAFSERDFSFDIPVVHGHWTGKLSSDNKSLSGTWVQGTPSSAPSPLNFERQAKRLPPPPPTPVTNSPAIAPVEAADMQAILSRDLEQALKTGALAPETSAGITVGVVRNGVRRVFSFGTAKPNSIFEIGSITKTFTGLVLAQMIVQGKVKLDEPVRELLPPGTVAKPQGIEISLLDLVTQHSGLPRMPDNFSPADPNNPYADYRAANLYQFVAKHGVEKSATSSFLYSNLGVGLLGQALANRAGTTYPNLVKKEVIEPLGLKDTVVSLSPEQQSRFIEGHSADHRPAHAWDLDALAGAGAIRSTADDMLTYLEANLHPEKFNSRGSMTNPNAQTLSTAFDQSHELRADAGLGMRIAFAWLYNSTTGEYWHDGGTGGYTSYVFFNPKGDYAAVVLMNTTLSARGSFADLVGQHISQRFAGKPAVSLASP